MNENNDAIELKNAIDAQITEKATEVATQGADALEAKATEINTNLEAKASNEDVASIQKQLDEMKNDMNANPQTFGISKKRTEFEDMFEKSASDYKSSGRSTMELTEKTFVAGTSSSTLAPSAYNQEASIKHLPNYKMQIRDVLPVLVDNNAGSIIWNRETAETDSAGPKAFGAEATQTSKTLTRQESTFRTLTNFYTMPEEYFNDIARFESYISNRLMMDLLDAESRQLLGGSGAGNNYNGLNTFGSTLGSEGSIGSWADSITGANRFDVVTALASILAQEDFTATCVILNPFDFYQMSLIKASTNEYVISQALDADGLSRMYWNGMELVKSNAQAAGTVTVMDKSQVEYVMREGVALEFDRNGTDFQANNISVRAQLRGNLADWNPTAVKTGSFATLIASVDATS